MSSSRVCHWDLTRGVENPSHPTSCCRITQMMTVKHGSLNAGRAMHLSTLIREPTSMWWSPCSKW
ncbi:hypothetical protein LEMLEM_LOCUS15874 [Lemmus lemmus]